MDLDNSFSKWYTRIICVKIVDRFPKIIDRGIRNDKKVCNLKNLDKHFLKIVDMEHIVSTHKLLEEVYTYR